MRELEKATMPDVQRIALYHLYNVDRALLIPRYAALCARASPLTYIEGKKLGLETALMIATGREEVRAAKGAGGARSPVEATLGSSELEAVVRQLFQITEGINAGGSSATPAQKEKEKEKEKGKDSGTITGILVLRALPPK